MRDYSKAKIYKIECNVTNDVYYGSTTSSLSDRLLLHKSKRDCSAINIIDRGNYTCKIIEEFPCKSRQELEARESYYIRNNLCINIRVPGRTKKEWCEDNIEYVKQKAKDYREDNKEKYKQYHKEYRKANIEILKSKQNEKLTCDCGGKYTRRNYSHHCKTKKHQDYLTTLT